MSSHRRDGGARRVGAGPGPLARPAGQALVIFLVFVVGAALAGALWEWWWSPPSGIVMNHRFLLDEVGLPEEFSGTGQYVLVAVSAGFLLGALVALLLPRRPFLTLVTTLVAAVVGGWVMAWTGHLLGPPDPGMLAATLPDLTALVSDLDVTGWAPYFALPVGAMAGLGTVMLLQAATAGFRSGTDETPSKVAS